MLVNTGLLGLLSLRILIMELSFRAGGFICSKYLCWCLSITNLRL
jgi:hypothetical protein